MSLMCYLHGHDWWHFDYGRDGEPPFCRVRCRRCDHEEGFDKETTRELATEPHMRIPGVFGRGENNA